MNKRVALNDMNKFKKMNPIIIIENGNKWWSCRRDILHGKKKWRREKKKNNIIEEMNINKPILFFIFGFSEIYLIFFFFQTINHKLTKTTKLYINKKY